MFKYLSLAIALAACGNGDKCSKVYDKLAPVFEKTDKKPDKAKEIDRCKQELKKHPDREAAMDCILALPGTPTMGDLMACESKRDGIKDYQDKSKAIEASLQLDKLGKSAKRLFGETSAFPIAKAPLTPATDCCKGPSGKCPVDATAWAAEPWKALEFQIDEPHLFRYSYESTDGKSFTATAVGDPDCSGKPVTYTLAGSVDAAGNPSVKLTKPN